MDRKTSNTCGLIELHLLIIQRCSFRLSHTLLPIEIGFQLGNYDANNFHFGLYNFKIIVHRNALMCIQNERDHKVIVHAKCAFKHLHRLKLA